MSITSNKNDGGKPLKVVGAEGASVNLPTAGPELSAEPFRFETQPGEIELALTAERDTWAADWNPPGVTSNSDEADIGLGVLNDIVFAGTANVATSFIVATPPAKNDMLPLSVWTGAGYDSLRTLASSHMEDIVPPREAAIIKLPIAMRGALKEAA